VDINDDYMTKDALLGFVEGVTSNCMRLLGTKGHDYAGEDVHANFKRMHKICDVYDIRPGERQTDVYLFMILLKLDRYINVSRGKAPKHESLYDTVLDLINYILLMESHRKYG